MEHLPARESLQEAQTECDRMNAILQKPKETWSGMSREPFWVKEIANDFGIKKLS